MMRYWGITPAVAVVALVAGCGDTGSTSIEPLPTDGPNQVVLSVPGMT